MWQWAEMGKGMPNRVWERALAWARTPHSTVMNQRQRKNCPGRGKKPRLNAQRMCEETAVDHVWGLHFFVAECDNLFWFCGGS